VHSSVQAARSVTDLTDGTVTDSGTLCSGSPGRIDAGLLFLFLLAAPATQGAQVLASPDEEAQVLIDEKVEATIDPDEIGLDQLDGIGDQDEAELPGWVDEAHAEATNRAEAIAQWTDAFFGAPALDAERTDTFLRLIVGDEWNRKEGHDLKFRARGQVQLPRISRRLHLVFEGEPEDDNLAGEDSASRSEDAGLRLNVRNRKRVRLDATLSASSSGLVPGVRLRYQSALSDNSWYRATQRFQYDTGDGGRSISQLGMYRYLDEGSMLQLHGRVRYREDRGFWDWRTSLVYRRWLSDHEKYPSAIQYFIGWGGDTNPGLETRNFRFGVLYRRQWRRPWLYYEIEPNYALRKDTEEETRKWYPGITLRLEVMLDRDLIR